VPLKILAASHLDRQRLLLRHQAVRKAQAIRQDLLHHQAQLNHKELKMDKDIVKGKWTEIKGKLKQQWGKLTDDDIAGMKGSYEELEGKLQTSYGYQKDQAKNEINTFLTKNGYYDKE
jgi:uncharacterized protein YjbJ (UPF0337 family)